MTTAKLIMDGEDQILLIPDEYYVRAKTVAFRKDEKTGDIIMSPVHRRRGQKKAAGATKSESSK
jgi:hypothetical protein